MQDKIEDVHVSIPVIPFMDSPFGLENIPLPHSQEGDIIKFELSTELYWVAKITGIEITYTVR